jgi:hypothetical protein
MDFTARHLKLAIRNPAAAARSISAEAVAAGSPIRRSPQRPTFEAAVRRYFAAGRDASVLLADYDRRWARAERRESADSAFRTGRQMAERFATLDHLSPAPEQTSVPSVSRPILGHNIRLGHDVVLRSAEGLVLRQLLTDSDITRSEHLRLYAVASLLHFEVEGAELARVEIWQLRFHKEFGWPRWALIRQAPVLRERCDEVARHLAQDAA